MKKLSPIVFTFLVIFSACGKIEKPVSRSEAITIKNIIDSSIKNKNAGLLNRLFNANLLAAQIAKKRGKRSSRALVNNVSSALNSAAIAQQIMSSIKKNGFYELVKQYEKNKKQHLIYRLYADGSLNYHDYLLDRKNGKVYIADMFIYLSGEDFSETISELAESLEENKITDDKKMKGLTQIRLLMNEGKYTEAKKAYEKLPGELKGQRSLQIMNILICSQISEEAYSDAIDKFKQDFPNEPYMYLMMINSSILQKDYDAALDYVNKIDSAIDTDPFLDYYRGFIYREKGDAENAIKHYEMLFKNMPQFADGVLVLIEQYIISKESEKARETIAFYKKEKEFNQLSLTYLLATHPEFIE